MTPEIAAFLREMAQLSQREASHAERKVAERALSGCSVWADGMPGESLAHVALALAAGCGRSVLFVSPSESTWEDRRLRLGPRGPWRALDGRARTQTVIQRSVVSITPDALGSPVVTRALGPRGPDVVIVEEAQATCPQSGSFRPSLRQVASWARRFPHAVVIGAAPASSQRLRLDVSTLLGRADLATEEARVQGPLLDDPRAIRLEVGEPDEGSLAERIAKLARPAVVFCATPAQADEMFARLDAHKVPAHRYHSALPAAERARELLHFALPGRRAVLVAVSAFGPSSGFEGSSKTGVAEEFGRDYFRRDIRSIVHLCAPSSLAQYTKELSLLCTDPQAVCPDESAENLDVDGADHGPATALLFFTGAHLQLNLALLQRKRPTREAVESILALLLASEEGANTWNSSALHRALGGSPRELDDCLRFLRDAGVLLGDDALLLSPGRAAESGAEVARALEVLRAGDEARLNEVAQYAEAPSCRLLTLRSLLQLGQAPWQQRDDQQGCGTCDLCAPGSDNSAATVGRTLPQLADRRPATRVAQTATPGAASARTEPAAFETRWAAKPRKQRRPPVVRQPDSELPGADAPGRPPIALRPLARAKAR